MIKDTVDTKIASHVHTQRFSVPYEFPVCFTENVFDVDNPLFVDTISRLEPEKCHRCTFVVDDAMAKARPKLVDDIERYFGAHATRLSLVGDITLVPGGERIKTDLHFVEQMQQYLYEHHVDRHSFMIAVGGGALLDAAGLVAATTHRGVRHVRIPTTVLAQDDSGVGVKNGVNLFGSKNFIGTFAPPFAVINDFDLLSTLSSRDKIAGMAEAVKVALIRDAEFFSWLEHNADALSLFDKPAMATLIRRCAELHMHQIAHGGDPFESGSARPLDYGHWSAHKLESITQHHVRHGEAVAIGIALDARYSVLTGLLQEGMEERICCLLEHLGFTLWHPALNKSRNGKRVILEGMDEFREHLGGELTITLLADLGVGIEVHEMDHAKIGDAIDWLHRRQQA